MFNTIDHTLLEPWVTEDNIRILCEESFVNDFRGVCINPKYIKFAKELPPCGLVSAAVDFPLGCSLNKIDLAKEVVYLGADEIDVVWDLASFLDKKYLKVTQELHRIINLGTPVKVIVESCFLNVRQQEIAHQIVKDSGAWCITNVVEGNKVDTIKLWKNLGGLKIKASGSIKTFLGANALINAGADIVGTSAGVQICAEAKQIEQKLVAGLENFAIDLENETIGTLSRLSGNIDDSSLQ